MDPAAVGGEPSRPTARSAPGFQLWASGFFPLQLIQAALLQVHFFFLIYSIKFISRGRVIGMAISLAGISASTGLLQQGDCVQRLFWGNHSLLIISPTLICLELIATSPRYE